MKQVLSMAVFWLSATLMVPASVSQADTATVRDIQQPYLYGIYPEDGLGFDSIGQLRSGEIVKILDGVDIRDGDQLTLGYDFDRGEVPYLNVQTLDGLTGWIRAEVLGNIVQGGELPATPALGALDIASGLMPDDTCDLVVGRFTTLQQAMAEGFGLPADIVTNPRILQNRSGDFLLSSNNVRTADAPFALRELALGYGLEDATCERNSNIFAVFDSYGRPFLEGSEITPVFLAEDGSCYFTVASRQNTVEVARFQDENPPPLGQDYEVYSSENGWLAITLGTVLETAFEGRKQSWSVPTDSTCLSGASFVSRLPPVCAGMSFQCGSGHHVTVASCEVENIIRLINQRELLTDEARPGSFFNVENGFCHVPDEFLPSDMTISSYLGGDLDASEFRFLGYTAEKDFEITLLARTQQVLFEWRVDRPQVVATPDSTQSGSSARCISVNGACTGVDCIIDELSISGGPGVIDNSWSSPSICSGGAGLEGIYQYAMRTNFGDVCTGQVQITSQSRSGATIDVYESDCSINFVLEY